LSNDVTMAFHRVSHAVGSVISCAGNSGYSPVCTRDGPATATIVALLFQVLYSFCLTSETSPNTFKSTSSRRG
jgi:predicted membrane channel-forming protein YqfA (hemolysin III family)